MPSVDLNVYIVGKDTPDTINRDLAVANQTYQRLNIIFKIRHQDRLPDAKIVAPFDGKFYESQLGLLASNTNLTQERDCIDIYYMNKFYSADVRGVTVRPDGQPEGYRGRPPIRPFILINCSNTSDSTLAHELGHALLDDGGHVDSSDNLMASGAVRSGNAISQAQVQKILASPYVKS